MRKALQKQPEIQQAERPRPAGRLGVLVAAGLGLYLVLFYTTRLPTIEQVTGGTFRRIDYWQFLLLPEMLLGVWFGDPPALGLFDRLPVLLFAGLMTAYAATLGWILLVAVGADRALTRLESFVFSNAVGLATVSTYTLAVGLLGWLHNPMVFWLPAVLSMALFSKLWLRRAKESVPGERHEFSQRKADSIGVRQAEGTDPADWLDPRWLWPAAPFALVIVLGGVLPPVDFDVLEYHLQAPKEFYAEGHIGFLPHNVYANMPLGASMFALAAMGITGDWWLGALVGKTVVALTAPLTALALLAAGRRLHSNTAGTVAAVLYLATPWVVHVSTAGLAESPLAMYSFLAVYATVLLPAAPAKGQPSGCPVGVHASACRTPQGSLNPDTPASQGSVFPSTILHPYANYLLAGYLAGTAAACKYPGILFVLVPLLAWTAWRATRNEEGETANAVSKRSRPWFPRLRNMRKPVAALLCAAALGGGLWYAKNWAFTGNPTYPLLFELFGDRTGTWDAASNAQWNRVHLPDGFSPVTLGRDLATVFLRSEWLGPLLFPLALLAVAARRFCRTEAVPVVGAEDAAEGDCVPGRRTARRSVPATGRTAQRSVPATGRTARRSVPATWVLAGYFAWFIAAWWLLTHRIDRFWIPSLAVVAVLAGVGATWTDRAWWRRALLWLFLLTSLASLLVAVSPAPGNYKRFFLPLERARTDPLRVNPWHLHFNANPPKGTLLLVGDAAVFDLEVPILYSTCFDETPLRRLADEGTAEAIRRRLAEAGVSHVLVHWGEIARYRATYGFDPWVQPDLFEELVEQQVLAPLPPIDDHPARAYRVVR